MELNLRDRRAIVTGGSKGLGFAIARELVDEGAVVRICARHGDEVAAAVEELGPRAGGRAADMRDPRQLEDFITWSVQDMGGVDILVNNAGGAHPGDFESVSAEVLVEDYAIKVLAMHRAVQAALPWLRRSVAARVVNIGSVHAKGPDHTMYSTTVNRAAGLNLTKAMAQELGPENILVNAVNIGSVETPQWENIHARRAPEKTREEFFSDMAQQIPLRRFGLPDEVSGIVAFLASDRASYITGASIDVAGGKGQYT